HQRKETTMSPLRERMIEDMTLAGDCQNFCVRDVIISPPPGKMTVSASDRPGKCIILADLCSWVRSKRLFLRPDLPCHRQSRASRVKFAAQRRDRSHAQPPLGGEHGEDPRFDRSEHGAMLRQGGASHCFHSWK